MTLKKYPIIRTKYHLLSPAHMPEDLARKPQKQLSEAIVLSSKRTVTNFWWQLIPFCLNFITCFCLLAKLKPNLAYILVLFCTHLQY